MGTFPQTLDVFYYRTGSHVEMFGRVVFEAIACGLPVVCHSNRGYADHIRHGENGFLFETTQQAARILADLKADPALRATVGREARLTRRAAVFLAGTATAAGFLSALAAHRPLGRVDSLGATTCRRVCHRSRHRAKAGMQTNHRGGQAVTRHGLSRTSYK